MIRDFPAERLTAITPRNTAATAAATHLTPTVSEFLNAANCEYVLNGTPAGMHAFSYNGAPVTLQNELSGAAASVWVTAENQIVIAYQGTTGGENIITNPVIALTQLLSDVGVYAGQTTQAETDSLNFAKLVVSDATQEGYSSTNIFVTGHSLGGIEAEYVASQTGLGGIGFETTGLPASDITGKGQNFVNTVTYGDPVANYASDISGEQPFAPAFVSGGGTLPHYGHIVMVGNPADQATLTSGVANWGDGNIFDQFGVLGNLLGLIVDFHLPGVQAHDLGVTLNPYSSIVDSLGSQTATPFSVANDTIPTLLGAAHATGHLLIG